MIKKIKELIKSDSEQPEDKKVILLDPVIFSQGIQNLT